MKLIAAEAKIIKVQLSKLGLYNVSADIDGQIHEFSVVLLGGEPVIISTSIIDALIANDTDLAYQLSDLFTAVYFLHKTTIEERAHEA